VTFKPPTTTENEPKQTPAVSEIKQPAVVQEFKQQATVPQELKQPIAIEKNVVLPPLPTKANTMINSPTPTFISTSTQTDTMKPVTPVSATTDIRSSTGSITKNGVIAMDDVERLRLLEIIDKLSGVLLICTYLFTSN
jgi:hypothetical protein